MEVRDIVLRELQKKIEIDDIENVDKINYIEDGYIDSLGIVQFIVALEEAFDIEFTNEEVDSDAFRVVGSLIEMIEKKIGKE